MFRKVLAASAVLLAACATANVQEALPSADAPAPGPDEGVYPSMMRMTGEIVGVDGAVIGALNMLEGPNGVLMEVTINAGGLAPGWHGLHLHQVGSCEDIGTFKLSGGHVGKVEGGHGLLNPVGPEGGDLPNIFAAGDGSAGYEAFSNRFALSELADSDGAALIIHAGRDDHLSQPIGGAGDRVACAVIG